MLQEDFTKGISPAGGRRFKPGSHMESGKACVKGTRQGSQDRQVGIVQRPQDLRRMGADVSVFIDAIQKASGKLR